MHKLLQSAYKRMETVVKINLSDDTARLGRPDHIRSPLQCKGQRFFQKEMNTPHSGIFDLPGMSIRRKTDKESLRLGIFHHPAIIGIAAHAAGQPG